MTTDFPVNTLIFIMFITALVGIGTALALNQSFARLTVSNDTKRRWQAGVVIALAGWFVMRTALGHSTLISGTPLVILSFVVAFSAAIVPMIFSPTFRQAVRTMPQTWLIGVHIIRIGGFAFLALLDMHLLPAQFALPTGYGDITVSLLAPFVIYALLTNKPYARGLAILWNLLGLLDFVSALTTGTAFILPFVQQIAANGNSIDYLSYVLMIPGYAVPILTLMHINSLRNLLSKPQVSPSRLSPERVGA